VPRRPPLSKEVQDEIVEVLYEAMDDDLSDREEWVAKRVRSLEDWLTSRDGIKDTPWEGASNITPPLIAKAARALHSRIIGSLFNADPLVHVIPVNTKNRDAARVREKFLNWQIRNDIRNFYRELNTATLEMVVQGTSFVMLWFERKRELLPEWKIVPRELPSELGMMLGRANLEKTDQEVIEEVLDEVRSAVPMGDHRYKVTHVDDGYEFESFVTVDKEDPNVRETEISVTIEREFIVDQMKIKNLPTEDIVVPANATTTQRDDCHHLARLFWSYPNQIRRKKMTKEYHNLTEVDCDRLDSIVEGRDESTPRDVHETDEVLDDYQGIDFTNGLSGVKEKKVLCVEFFHPWDVNGDSLDEEMDFIWIPALKKLATWDYSTVRYGHDRRPVIDFHFIPVTGRFYSLGLAELEEQIQAEAATLFNQMNDRGNLTNAPYMLVEHNAGISPNVVKQLPPGSAIPVRNVDRIKPLEWSKNAGNEFPILQSLYAFAEQLAGVGDISSGVQPNRPNAPRTARGTLALISESNILIDTHVLNVQFISMEELIHQLDALNRQFMPPEMDFFILGETSPTTITRDDLKDRVRFYFSGNTANTNTQVKQQIAQIIYSTLSTNPIFTGLVVEMPEPIIRAQYVLAEFFAREFLPGKDASFLLPPVDVLVKTANEVQQARIEGMQQKEQADRQAAQEMQSQEIEAGLLETAMKEHGEDRRAERQAVSRSNGK
jgi:hypothetical protein